MCCPAIVTLKCMEHAEVDAMLLQHTPYNNETLALTAVTAELVRDISHHSYTNCLIVRLNSYKWQQSAN
jgi:hypothetical protein